MTNLNDIPGNESPFQMVAVTAASVTITDNDTWETKDVSATIPAGAVAAILKIDLTGGTTSGSWIIATARFRKDSASQEIADVEVGGTGDATGSLVHFRNSFQVIVPLTTSRTFDVRIDNDFTNAAGQTLAVYGYIM
jgi:hypothetical protein